MFNELYKVILCSQYYGINLIPISFPLTFNIVNNYLVSDIYLIISIDISTEKIIKKCCRGTQSRFKVFNIW